MGPRVSLIIRKCPCGGCFHAKHGPPLPVHGRKDRETPRAWASQLDRPQSAAPQDCQATNAMGPSALMLGGPGALTPIPGSDAEVRPPSTLTHVHSGQEARFTRLHGWLPPTQEALGCQGLASDTATGPLGTKQSGAEGSKGPRVWAKHGDFPQIEHHGNWEE